MVISYFAYVTASSPFLTAPIGVLLQGTVIDTFGRKSALLFNIVPHFVGWLLIYWNRHLSITFVGRCLSGLTTPSMFYASQVYAIECLTVNHPKLVANFGAWPAIADSCGMLLIYMLGVYFNYLQISLIAVAFAFASFCIIGLFIPESPSWLYEKGKIGDAEIAEKKLGISQSILKSSNKKRSNLPVVKVFKFSPSNLRSTFQQLQGKHVVKPLIISSATSIFIAVIGGTPLTAYMLDVMSHTSSFNHVQGRTFDILYEKINQNSYYYSVISGCIILVSVSLTSFMLPIVGVRKLTISCTLIMVIGWISIGFATVRTGFYWLHVTGVWVTLFGFFLGAMNGPVSVLGDIFPLGGKGLASVPIVLYSLTSAFSNKIYPYLQFYFGGYMYFMYSGACLLYGVYAYFALPETVGRTYEEINVDFLKVFTCF